MTLHPSSNAVAAAYLGCVEAASASGTAIEGRAMLLHTPCTLLCVPSHVRHVPCTCHGGATFHQRQDERAERCSGHVLLLAHRLSDAGFDLDGQLALRGRVVGQLKRSSEHVLLHPGRCAGNLRARREGERLGVSRMVG